MKHGVYSMVTVAQQRARKLKHRVSRLQRDHPHLAEMPRHLVLRYVEADYLAAKCWVELQDGPLENADGEPRRLLREYRHLLAELRGLASTLRMLDLDVDPLAALGGER